MIERPQPGAVYRHFKGNLYRIIAIATHSETREELVIYEALYGSFGVYARPLSMFMEPVDRAKYPDAQQQYRFEVYDAAAADKIERAIQTTPQETTPQDMAQTLTENIQDTQEAQELQLDPLVLAFLDADTFEKKLELLRQLHPRITDEMITTMALSADIEIEEGELEQRYEELKNCLLTFDRFECSRLR